ncbi:glycosyltransferase [Jatrophihabitans sp.]|uniref:glycosyltransferase n=1 Tax=Jatrophihabitans sp. TaxID=1932789 RepID=UPI0030C74082|nr:hypothetical protein [Jatrophihabitans sp.]
MAEPSRAPHAAPDEPFAGLGLSGLKLLVVASTGGHVAQAVKIADLVGASAETLFVTFRSPQSEILTEGRRVAYVPYVHPRDYKGVLRAAPVVREILATERFDAVLSTGAGIALSVFPWATLRRASQRTRMIYIESFSRFEGPSVTGRIARRWPRVETYTQHPEWASSAWSYQGDAAPARATGTANGTAAAVSTTAGEVPRIFVTLGTIRPYRFDALLDRIRDTLPDEAEITWQLGCTDRTDLPGTVHTLMSANDFLAAAQAADIVISHGGVGTAMALVEMGKRTVLVPRRAQRNEHVDDHQVQVCRDFEARGLVTYREVDQLTTADLAG